MLSSEAARKNWQPLPELVARARKEIETQFENGYKADIDNPSIRTKPKKLEPDFLDDCAKISAFLMDKDAVLNQLKRLNDCLVAKMKSPADKTNVYILRQTLEEELGKLGYQPNFGKALGEVHPTDFRSAIKERWLIKDPSLGGIEHGEFTHAIQWLLIAWQQEDNNDFLKKPVVDVFTRLGEEDSVYIRRVVRRPSEPVYIDERNLWDLIVDNPLRKDFRSPEILNTFLLNNFLESISALCLLIKIRFEQRYFGTKNKKYPMNELPTTFQQRKEDRIPYTEKIGKIVTPKPVPKK